LILQASSHPMHQWTHLHLRNYSLYFSWVLLILTTNMESNGLEYLLLVGVSLVLVNLAS
jgi:hypothetical protein